MLTFSDLQTNYTDQTNDTSAANLAFGKRMLSRGHGKLVRAGDIDTSEYRITLDSVDGQYVYPLPPQYSKMKSVVWVDGNTRRGLTEVTSVEQWDMLRDQASSGDPLYFMTRKSLSGRVHQELWLYPTPSQDNIDIDIIFNLAVVDFVNDDYTTGTVAVTAAGTTVTGTTTVWTSAMVGRSIKLPDGQWYDISAVASATSLSIHYPYQGDTASGQSYTIGEVPLIPEPHHDAIYAYAVCQYYSKRREYEADVAYWKGLFDESEAMLIADRQNRSTQQVLHGDDLGSPRTVNEYPVGPL